jgi:S-(hydroxymethyl)glutathione dehydrogenase/alcohol dehydrogenase
MTEVRAAVGQGDGSFRMESLKIDDPQAGEVLIRMRASGVCYTDWDSLRWTRRIILGRGRG